MIDGEPMFVARDVALALGYSDPEKAVRQHCRADRVKCPLRSGNQMRQTTLIPERDVYRLIINSKLPAAEAFEEWVVGEVLPSIRKTGAYVVGQPKKAELFQQKNLWGLLIRSRTR